MKPAAALLLPQALTATRLILGVSAVSAALDGRLNTAATLVSLGAVTDGLDGFVARRLRATSSFGALFDYFADYLCYIFAPWAIARTLLGPELGWWREVILTLPFLTAAIRYARNGLIVADPSNDGEVPGLGTVFFAFLCVAAVFLDARSVVREPLFAAAFGVLVAVFALLMVAPFRCPKMTAFRGMSPTVLVLIAIMPFVATKTLAAAMFVIGVCYPVAARMYARTDQVR
jgi:CDP-diacylglycerol--serine O-phosphatidyltransferase